MIVEYIRYKLPTERAEQFEAAYVTAAASLDASSHCLGYELARGVEEPEHYVLRIQWDSLDGHMQGFRTGPDFPAFFAAVRPFVDQIAEMKHYRATAVVAAEV